MDSTFDFEKLDVWQKAMNLAEVFLEVAEELEKNKHFRLAQQLEASGMSVPQNIAEGKGQYSKKEFIHYLHIARGSLYESLTIILMCDRKRWINSDMKKLIYIDSQELGKMINGLINYLRKSM